MEATNHGSDAVGMAKPNHEEELLSVIRRLARSADLRSRNLLSNVGLTSPQLAALKAISRLQPAAVTSLAKELHLGLPTVTGILQRLERRGLIERLRDANDRRSMQVTLTQAGRESLQNAPSPLQQHFSREFSKLQDWEQTLMLSTLQRIAGMLDSCESPEPGGRSSHTEHNEPGNREIP